MDSLTLLHSSAGSNGTYFPNLPTSAKAQLNQLVTTEVLTQDAARVDFDVDELYKSLSIGAQKILEKLNAILGDKVSGGIESLKPEDHTPEKTAETIVKGIAAFFEAYAKSNADLDPEELITRFFAAARSGVDTGYGDASKTLEGLGAFEVDGVKDGIEQTKSLIEEKLAQLEAAKRREYALDTEEVEEEVAATVSGSLFTQAGTQVTASRRLDLSA